jgi:hypothetical protein
MRKGGIARRNDPRKAIGRKIFAGVGIGNKVDLVDRLEAPKAGSISASEKRTS